MTRNVERWSTAFGRARRAVRLVDVKNKRMPFIAANRLLVLDCAIFLDLWASSGALHARFCLVQALELVAGGRQQTPT